MTNADPPAGRAVPAARMSRGTWSEQEQLETIRAWYGRHAKDYCHHDAAPPKVWSEYVHWLLTRIDVLEAEAAVGARLVTDDDEPGA